MYAINLRTILFFLIFFSFYLAGCKKEDTGKTGEGASFQDNQLLISSEQKGLDVFLLIDQSGSMMGHGGVKATDPDGNRIIAARYFNNFLGGFSNEINDNRVCMINFGSDNVPLDVIPLTALKDREGRDKLNTSMKVSDMGATSVMTAIKEVKKIYETEGGFKPNRQLVIIIFTDGQPNDTMSRKLGKGYFDKMAEFISKELTPPEYVFSPAPKVFVIGMDVTGSFWEKDKDGWEKVAPGNCFKIDRVDEESLSMIYHDKILVNLLGFNSEPIKLRKNEEKEIEIGPYIEKVTFSVFQPRGKGKVKLSVTKPDGNPLDTKAPVIYEESETSELYIIPEPAMGKWKVKVLEGEGEINVIIDEMPVRMKLLKPYAYHPQGLPMKFEASFLKADGSQVQIDDTHPLFFGADVYDSKGEKHFVKFLPFEKGIYKGDTAVPTPVKGKYRVELSVKVGGEEKPLCTRKYEIDVVSMPYVEVNTPVEGNDPVTETLFFWKYRPVKLDMTFKKEGKEIKSTDILEEDPRKIIVGGIAESPDNKSNVAFFIEPADMANPVNYKRTLYPSSMTGHYLVKVQLDGTLKENKKKVFFQDEILVTRVAGKGRDVKIGIIKAVIILIMIFIIKWWIEVGLYVPSGKLTIKFPDGPESTYPLGSGKFYRKVIKIGKGCHIDLKKDKEVKGEIARIFTVTVDDKKAARPGKVQKTVYQAVTVTDGKVSCKGTFKTMENISNTNISGSRCLISNYKGDGRAISNLNTAIFYSILFIAGLVALLIIR